MWGENAQSVHAGIILGMDSANERRRHIATSSLSSWAHDVGIIMVMGSANERRRYNVTSSLIGWAHTYNDPWLSHNLLHDWYTR